MTEPDLFDHALQERMAVEAPLAARMRPRSLEEFVGQREIIGRGRLLRRAIEADKLFSSILLWGPPGSGKTTLANIIANSTASYFTTLSAVLAGVRELRAVIAAALERRKLHGVRTILFVDEVHRWNKAQQDALLPHVERGVIVLIGATTENPYFEVIGALVSRSRVFQFQVLSDDDTRWVLQEALKDSERGYGGRQIEISLAGLEHLVAVAGGDARNALNALELAVESTPPGEHGAIEITLDVAQESIQRRAVLYDRDGDAHYDTISAFIKSVRGSDPDAALYWLAKMLYAGESPRSFCAGCLFWRAKISGWRTRWDWWWPTRPRRRLNTSGFPRACIRWWKPLFIFPPRRNPTAPAVFFRRIKQWKKRDARMCPCI